MCDTAHLCVTWQAEIKAQNKEKRTLDKKMKSAKKVCMLVLQCSAVRCGVLQYIAVCRSVLQNLQL